MPRPCLNEQQRRCSSHMKIANMIPLLQKESGKCSSAIKVRSEKLQNRSFPNFSNLRPEFCPEYCSEFSPNLLRSFRASFRGKRRPEKIHQKSPPFCNAKFPGKFEEKIHKSFLESGQSSATKGQKGDDSSWELPDQACVFPVEPQVPKGKNINLHKKRGFRHCQKKCGKSVENRTFCVKNAQKVWFASESPHFLALFLESAETPLFVQINVFAVWDLRLDRKYTRPGIGVFRARSGTLV